MSNEKNSYFNLTGESVEVEVNVFGIYVNGKDLLKLIEQKIGTQRFTGNIKITLESLDTELKIASDFRIKEEGNING